MHLGSIFFSGRGRQRRCRVLLHGVVCDPLPAHRKHYLDYEGPVSNNRGQVSQWDTGLILAIDQQDDQLSFRLSGSRLHGRYQLERNLDTTSEQVEWILSTVNDEASEPSSG